MTCGYAQTSDVWPSRIVTSWLEMSQGKVVVFVEMSIGSGPILHIHRHINYLTRNQYAISHPNRTEDVCDSLCALQIGSDLS